MGFSRQEYWSGLHALLQGIFLIQGSNPCLIHLPILTSLFFTTSATLEALLSGKTGFSITYPDLPAAISRDRKVVFPTFYMMQDCTLPFSRNGCRELQHTLLDVLNREK
ncbi:unnamed protein product [Rangifer tarandus platyrhynchus]|uniref:Uncharacterized protein n=2 Tax=Rangifer tarandus platyrhynchus TaxID=3082113 RepID=A0AC59Z5T0_RANTA|nr:unnamed protein product [Rangifer tarandus platyrhynchus]